jgi:cobalt/nickel transport system permease protein
MTHQWHDSYRHAKTPAHHLDPRSKLFVGLCFVLMVLLTPDLNRLQRIGFPTLVVMSALLAGIPMLPLVKRFATLLPFVILMALSARVSQLSRAQFAVVLEKALCSIAAMAVLSLTTPFPDLLRALEQMHLPRSLVMFLAFLYRYGGVLYEEALQLERAWAARYFGRFWLKQWAHLGHILASLLVRSYERAERIFAAMQARGFSSGAAGVHLLHMGLQDAVFISSSLVLLAMIRWAPV